MIEGNPLIINQAKEKGLFIDKSSPCLNWGNRRKE